MIIMPKIPYNTHNTVFSKLNTKPPFIIIIKSLVPFNKKNGIKIQF